MVDMTDQILQSALKAIVSAHYLFCGISPMAREKGSQRDVADHLTVRFLIVFAGTFEKSGKKYLTRISRKKK